MALYLAASALAAGGPLPGGLGVMEPALATGLMVLLHVSLLLALFDRYRSTRSAGDLQTSTLAARRAESERRRVAAAAWAGS